MRCKRKMSNCSAKSAVSNVDDTSSFKKNNNNKAIMDAETYDELETAFPGDPMADDGSVAASGPEADRIALQILRAATLRRLRRVVVKLHGESNLVGPSSSVKI